MAAPTLTAAEIAQLNKELATQTGIRDAMLAAIPAKQARSAELSVADGSFKKFFDYYNSIITDYDTERKALNGDYIAAPITEVDITNSANLIASRTTPSLPATDVVRISEFDGGPLITDANNEVQHISDQAATEIALTSGFVGTVPTVSNTSLTTTSLTSSSTTLGIKDLSSAMSFAIGDIIVVDDGGTNTAVVKVTSVTDNAGGDPPYDFTLGISILVAPLASIAIGSNTDSTFSGFTDSERNSKTATNTSLQPIMDSLISDLTAQINSRISVLATQTSALSSQQDPDAVSEISATQTLVSNSNTTLSNYLISLDISDVGLGQLSSERGTRGSEITTRLAQILSNFTNQTENYFDRRYSTGNDRGNTSRGTLRLQKNSEAGEATAQDLADNAQTAINALTAIIP